jgi:GTPase
VAGPKSNPSASRKRSSPQAARSSGSRSPETRSARGGSASATRQRRRPEKALRARRAGTVALVGRPNVGKSTLLNAALQHPLAIVSPTPQTTRDALLGVARHCGAEIAFLDTPGLHRPRTELGRVMNHAAREALRRADAIVFVTDVPDRKHTRPARRRPAGAGPSKPPEAPPLLPHPGDLTLLADLGSTAPVVLVVNKIDRLRNKAELLPLLDALGRVRELAAVVPVSALREDGVDRMLDEVVRLLPEGDFRFGEDDLTDRPARFFAGEYVREQILCATEAEVPHAAAVVIDQFIEPPGDRALQIDATIHVERSGQKKIIIGRGGEMLKRIGTAARMRIEELTGRPVNLKLWVRVTPSWRESPRDLTELGYGQGAGPASAASIPAEARPPDSDDEADPDDEAAAESQQGDRE